MFGELSEGSTREVAGQSRTRTYIYLLNLTVNCSRTILPIILSPTERCAPGPSFHGMHGVTRVWGKTGRLEGGREA